MAASSSPHNNLSNLCASGPKEKEIISDEAQSYIDLHFITIGFIAAFGTVTNVINGVIFIGQGIKDCMSLCLLSLTVTNLITVVFGLLTCLFRFLAFLNVETEFDLFSVLFILTTTTSMVYNISTITTTFIALERCLCVSLPLKFKDFVTYNRTIVILISIYVYDVVVCMPHLLTMRLISQYDNQKNSTKTVLWFLPIRAEVNKFIQGFVLLIVESLCLLVILASTVIMTVTLRRSLQRWTYHRGLQHSERNVRLITTGSEKEITKQAHSLKKRRVVKTVVILALVSFVCNSLRFIVLMISCIYPDLQCTQRNLFYDINGLLFLLQMINSSADIFVYFVFNSSFRRYFFEIFCVKVQIHIE